MFDKMFEDFKSGFEDWARSSIEELGRELNDRFGVPEPDGEFELFRSFDTSDPLISKGCITIENDSWRIEAYDSVPSTDIFERKSDEPVRNVKLFTFGEPSTEDCLAECRAWVKTSGMNKTAQLRLGFDREAEFFGRSGGKMSRYYEASISSSKWQEYSVRHFFQKDKYPTDFWLNLDFYEPGTIWIKDIRLFKAPAKRKE